jgi:predicted dehydrogenase
MSNNIKHRDVWLIGAGPMAIDHTKALLHLGISPKVIGRGEQSARHFEAQTGCKVIQGGLDEFLEKNKPDAETYIIIAVGTEALLPMLLKFKELSFGRILVEKPAAISIEELLAHESDLEAIQDKVFVAYNRRFYPSVQKALELIEEDGGLQSMHFEFTEWSHKIEPLKKAPGVKENWFFANSTHVVDLAFFIAGEPKEWNAYSKKGTLSWHEKSFFAGAGITEKDVIFSYHSNWESAGRWGVELMTNKRKILLKPLEGVLIQQRGTIKEEVYPLEEGHPDLKPGLLEQLVEYLGDKKSISLKSLKGHIGTASVNYSKIIA